MNQIRRHLIPALCLAAVAAAFFAVKSRRPHGVHEQTAELRSLSPPHDAGDVPPSVPGTRSASPSPTDDLDDDLREVSAHMSSTDEASTQWLLHTARTHPSPIIRSNAVHALASRTDERERMIAALDELFLEEKDPAVLHAALCTFRDFRAGTQHALDLLARSNEPILIRTAAALLADQPAPAHADAIDACVARLPEDPPWSPIRAELRETSLNIREPGRLEHLQKQHTCTESER
ncbi:MAG: hypothetical protein HYY16_04560 [Planctomycetes bacterium]|nr:hypothetical protein [Planctomycetota bacterium]